MAGFTFSAPSSSGLAGGDDLPAWDEGWLAEMHYRESDRYAASNDEVPASDEIARLLFWGDRSTEMGLGSGVESQSIFSLAAPEHVHSYHSGNPDGSATVSDSSERDSQSAVAPPITGGGDCPEFIIS
jgi:hypothetical protein